MQPQILLYLSLIYIFILHNLHELQKYTKTKKEYRIFLSNFVCPFNISIYIAFEYMCGQFSFSAYQLEKCSDQF